MTVATTTTTTSFASTLKERKNQGTTPAPGLLPEAGPCLLPDSEKGAVAASQVVDSLLLHVVCDSYCVAVPRKPQGTRSTLASHASTQSPGRLCSSFDCYSWFSLLLARARAGLAGAIQCASLSERDALYQANGKKGAGRTFVSLRHPHICTSDWRLLLPQVLFFITFLLLDMLIGVVEYPSQQSLLTCWVHHIFYIILLYRIVRRHLTAAFACLFIEEVGNIESPLWPSPRATNSCS